MNLKRGALIILLIALILPAVYAALGVSPAFYEVEFKPNLKQVFHFEFFSDNPDEELVVYAEGDLAKYAELSTDRIKGSGGVNVLLQLPEEIDLPGTQRIYIGTTPAPADPEEEFKIVANVRGVIKVAVPYPGYYATLEFRTENANVGKPIKFYLRVSSLGKESIIAESNIEIYDSRGIKIETLYVGNDLIDPGKVKDYEIKLDTTTYKAGDYKTIAVVRYIDQTIKAEATFRLGELFVDVTNYTKEFERDKINKFDIHVESFWNDPIENLFAKVIIQNTNIEFSTPSIKIDPWTKSTLTGFLDTAEIKEDRFFGNITLHYEGRTTEKIVELRFRKEINYLLYGTVLGIILLLIVVAVVYISLRKKKRKSKKIKKKL